MNIINLPKYIILYIFNKLDFISQIRFRCCRAFFNLEIKQLPEYLFRYKDFHKIKKIYCIDFNNIKKDVRCVNIAGSIKMLDTTIYAVPKHITHVIATNKMIEPANHILKLDINYDINTMLMPNLKYLACKCNFYNYCHLQNLSYLNLYFDNPFTIRELPPNIKKLSITGANVILAQPKYIRYVCIIEGITQNICMDKYKGSKNNYDNINKDIKSIIVYENADLNQFINLEKIKIIYGYVSCIKYDKKIKVLQAYIPGFFTNIKADKIIKL